MMNARLPALNGTPPPGNGRRMAAFTLVELVVTLAVSSILISVAAPSFSKMIATQRVKAAGTDLYIALSKARSEALKRNTSVIVTPLTSGHWESGWTIAELSDSTQKTDDHDPIRNIVISGPSEVTYRASGRVTATGASTTFDISATGVTTHICVSVDLSGRPYQKSSETSC
jgi:type IV fimbrial biogenesis protein FimT